jgi:hypothetical protein
VEGHLTAVWLSDTLAKMGLLPTSAIPMCLLNWDHRDSADKVDNMSWLKVGQRDLERARCDVVCIWCHYLHTAEQLKHRLTPGTTVESDGLAHVKELKGCQFPGHIEAPWAAGMPQKLPSASLTVTYHLRGDRTKTGIDAIESGAASVMCRACSTLWTALERLHMYPSSALSLHQRPVIEVYAPKFMQFFAERTANFDWASERARRDHRSIQRYTASRKRKREEEENEEEAEKTKRALIELNKKDARKEKAKQNWKARKAKMAEMRAGV